MTKSETLYAAADGQGCLGKSQDDEPVFVLVARDLFAADLVREWADRVEARAVGTADLTGARKEKLAKARLDAMAMDAWRQAHGGGKIPD